jgi:hypothetical protein
MQAVGVHDDLRLQSRSARGPIASIARAGGVGHVADMGDSEQGNVEDTVRRAREEMHSVTESLRALLQDLRGEAKPSPTAARSPESAPNP